MKIISRKTQKSIEKSLRKAIKRHAGALAAGLASGLASSLATLASTDAPGSGKSNLGVLAENVKAALTEQSEKLARKGRHEKKARHHTATPVQTHAEPAA